jgi:adenine-specific DNA glycosylase
VTKFCRARQSGDPESFPEKRKKREPVQIVLAAAVLLTPRGETLLLPPPGTKSENKPAADDVATLVSRMWHFPTIAIQKDPPAELHTFLNEFLPAQKGKFHLEPLAKVRHSVTYRNVTVLPFRVAVSKMPRIQGAKSIRLEDFSTLAVSNLTRKIARAALVRTESATENEQTLRL